MSLLTVRDRLSNLPPKMAKSFGKLLDIGHVDDITLNTVLDAAELAGDWNKALWFTSSYLFLRGKGIPVGDVIAMSIQHNRKINLEWSPKRWQAEHDKLSRLATLKMLSAAQRHFDVGYFEKHIHKKFPGYLIKTSRRLGMEGFRQRHCVAGYESRIQYGSTAIASVFVNHQRWTVELLKTGDDELPIQIGQVKTVFNEMATTDVRNTVHEYLGVATSKTVTNAGEQRALREINFARIIPVLRNLNVQGVSVDFSGCGDDGHIYAVSLYPEFDDRVLPMVSIVENTRDFQDGIWVYAEKTTEQPLREAIKSMVYDYLEMTGVDWFNNDGGQGAFNIDLEKGTVDFEVNQNYTEVTIAYANEWSIEDIVNNTL